MKINELTKFAITLGILPWIPAFILYKHSMIKAAAIVLVVFISLSLLCFVSKSFAKLLKDTLTKIGSFIGKYIAIVVLFFGYIFAILPTGILMKLVGRDRLRLKKPKLETYWKNNDAERTDYEYQF